MQQHYVNHAKRIVIKIGSALLVENATGRIHHLWLESLLKDVATRVKRGQEIIIVSSGAIALGRKHLNLIPPLQLQEKQAAAAIGQIQLAHAYQHILACEQVSVAQVLLTLEDSENRQRYINAKNTLETLLSSSVVPIINENDTIATAEIRYGDNDRLAARVAQMLSADVLVLLSDIEGLYTADPHTHAEAQLIPEVHALDNHILAMAGDSKTQYGSGGMKTKLAAAKIAFAAGCKMVIAAGKYLSPLQRIDETHLKTWFIPPLSPQNARKNWIAQHLKPTGSLMLDDGALAAIAAGNSLLAIGVTDVRGEFHKGEAVTLFSTAKEEIGKGLINYSSYDAKKIMGKKSHEYEGILGYAGNAALIRRDDLVLHKDPQV